ncbi:hypothetical protein CKAN_02567000 [Cinnamomum micranthum f. kanehirae]|uniref:Uncharacterized protein n=1 Tax=Cinnamomum micranthum f. kanehirae TaxID=337451 RepID=A0A443PZV6_9MAGN|nr:hypothetical protein CKAN_02567000 [Cinnamomum micranthum f. kanehirae]
MRKWLLLEKLLRHWAKRIGILVRIHAAENGVGWTLHP